MGSPSGHDGTKEVLKKGPWTKEEDQKLLSYIQEHGLGSWRILPQKAGLQRCGKSCRLRWSNYLRPDIKRGKFSSHEEKTIIRLHALLGNRWSAIAAHLPKRTDNEIKNYWNTRLKKRLTRMGIDPSTHKPKHNPPAPNLTHMAQWETARLEAEARLRHASKPLINNGNANNYYNNNINCYMHNSYTFPLVQPRPCLDVLKVWRATCDAANCSHDSGRSVNFVSDGTDCGYTETTKGNIGNSVHGHGLYDRNNYGEVVGYNCNVDFDGCDNDNSMMMSTDDLGLGHLEEGKSYWNELLNMVSSSNM